MSIGRFLRKIRKQDAIYWERIGIDAYGSHVFAEPVNIKVRWSDKQEVVVDEFNKQIVSSANIFTDGELALNSYVMKGVVTGDTPVSPLGVDGAVEIKWNKIVPDIKNRASLFKSYM